MVGLSDGWVGVCGGGYELLDGWLSIWVDMSIERGCLNGKADIWFGYIDGMMRSGWMAEWVDGLGILLG